MKISDKKFHSDEEHSVIDTPPSSPFSGETNDGNSKRELAKQATKAFGYIMRSIELLGSNSNRLAGAVSISQNFGIFL